MGVFAVGSLSADTAKWSMGPGLLTNFNILRNLEQHNWTYDSFSIFTGKSSVSPSPRVKRVILDSTLSFQAHISNVSLSAYFHLNNIPTALPFSFTPWLTPASIIGTPSFLVFLSSPFRNAEWYRTRNAIHHSCSSAASLGPGEILHQFRGSAPDL